VDIPVVNLSIYDDPKKQSPNNHGVPVREISILNSNSKHKPSKSLSSDRNEIPISSLREQKLGSPMMLGNYALPGSNSSAQKPISKTSSKKEPAAGIKVYSKNPKR
jgi:hypothetical protein